jgi:hypothetical protein
MHPKLTSHPFPILQPTTPQAFPRARTARGKISAGYTQGTVNQVAPKVEVKMKIIEAAAAPYDEAWPMSPSALAFMARRENPPARNMAMPCTIEPQYNVQRRPMRSKVKTQTRVAN